MKTMQLSAMILAAAALAAAPRPELGRLPLTFERTPGQAASKAGWIARGDNTTLRFLPGEVMLTTAGGPPVRMRMAGALGSAVLQGEMPQSQVSHYLHGRDQNAWRTSVEQFGRLRYKSIYRGIDLVFYCNRGLFCTPESWFEPRTVQVTLRVAPPPPPPAESVMPKPTP